MFVFECFPRNILELYGKVLIPETLCFSLNNNENGSVKLYASRTFFTYKMHCLLRKILGLICVFVCLRRIGYFFALQEHVQICEKLYFSKYYIENRKFREMFRYFIFITEIFIETYIHMK